MALSATQEECKVCGQVVPFLDQLTAGGSVYHPTCFQCEHCKTLLQLSDYSLHEGKTYCKLHLDELFGRSPEGRRESTEGVRKSVEGLRRSFEGSPLKNMAKNLQRTPGKSASFKFSGTQEKCATCAKTVYPLEKVSVEGQSYHKTCFKCLQGGCAISPSNYAALEGRVYCKPHFRQLFKEKGNYSQLLMKMPSSKLPDPEQQQ